MAINSVSLTYVHTYHSRAFTLITGIRTHFLLQLDMRQARHWQMKSSPDVLVFPSKMTALIKEIGGKPLNFEAKFVYLVVANDSD